MPANLLQSKQKLNKRKQSDFHLTNSRQFFTRLYPIIDHEFRQNIVKVAVDPRGDNRMDPQRKFTISFAFCAHVDVIKYPKHYVFFRAQADYVSFPPQRVCDRKAIGSRRKVANDYHTKTNFT